MPLAAADLTILALFVLGSVVAGIALGRRRGPALTDWALGGRDVPTAVVLLSIVATETSTVTFLSIPGFAFERDLTWLQLPIGFALGRLAVVALLLPRYFDGELLTAYEVLAVRFGGGVRRTASALFVVARTLGDGLRLFLTALVLEAVSGLDLAAAVAVLGAATIVYTFVGGMRAVVWMDAVQFAIYIAGAGLALIAIADRLPGGFEQVVAHADAAGKLRWLDLRLDPTEPYTLWAGLIGGACLSLGTHGADQMMVQRYLCARGRRQAATALSLSGLVVLAQFALFLWLGLALAAFYAEFPPAQPFERADRVFATFLVDELGAPLRGILLGAVFAAAMSTLSSSLQSSATSAIHDLGGASADPARQLRRTRLAVVGFGVAQIAVGIGGQWTSAAVVENVLAIAGFVTGLLLGVFFLGRTRHVGSRAALGALWLALLGMAALKAWTPLAWPWFPLVGAASTVGLGLLLEAVAPGPSDRQIAGAKRPPRSC